MREIASHASRHRRLHPGHRHADVALDARAPAGMPRTPTATRSITAPRQGVTFPLADALCWLLAVAPADPRRAGTRRAGPGESGGGRRPARATLKFFTDLCHVQTARAAGEVGRICAELVFGYNRHPAWDDEGYARLLPGQDELDALEGLIPGIASAAPPTSSTVDGSHPAKAGPCAGFDGLRPVPPTARPSWMVASPARAWPRTAPPKRVTKVMIPEALDYPA